MSANGYDEMHLPVLLFSLQTSSEAVTSFPGCCDAIFSMLQGFTYQPLSISMFVSEVGQHISLLAFPRIFNASCPVHVQNSGIFFL